ncbi:plastid division protein PDV2-like [Dioscorea cayenensis subsp. rotundata]|uniref:Plastid division protein PDV2-like n=1 Tax=Dioscorea cayennensis subsp. rotundata TaxID=55577 RepID=A0AB40CEM4_DIOCR|nr:plastid division protein PDV2-like [Dioscorea cayenensis subsp. rotundata]
MEAEEIGRVLGRSSDLRSKFNECIRSRKGGEEEEESIIGIRDAFESLDQQLNALQALRQQQIHEREATLAQIDSSCLALLNKLKEYRGEEELELIHEVSIFAGEIFEHHDDLLLPPCPRHLPDSMLDGIYASHLLCRSKLLQTGLAVGHTDDTKKSIDESEKRQSAQPLGSNGIGIGIGIVGFVTRSVIAIVGLVSILNLAGFKPCHNIWERTIKALQQFKFSAAVQRRRISMKCPPGKVLVIEDGKPRCMVKERVEIPFEVDLKTPNVTYGFG